MTLVEGDKVDGVGARRGAIGQAEQRDVRLMGGPTGGEGAGKQAVMFVGVWVAQRAISEKETVVTVRCTSVGGE